MPPSAPNLNVLALTLIPGLGPVLIGRAIKALGSPEEVLNSAPARLQTVTGIGPEKARLFFEHRRAAIASAEKELTRAATLGARIVAITDPDYPSLLRTIQDPPPILYIRGSLSPDFSRSQREKVAESSRPDEGVSSTSHSALPFYALAMVGSRACTQYGREQTTRFAGMIASAGITIVSGGARGIDTAAHTAAIQSGGRTVVVLGSGLAKPYPPENEKLFDQIVSEGKGAIVSELPIDAPPVAENFPTRNRLISGMSLGVLLIEAASGSGSLITARLAADDHGREVFAVPGRVDSAASEGVNELIKSGCAQLVTNPADVIAALETPARHTHNGTHATRYANPNGLFDSAPPPLPAGEMSGGSASDRGGMSLKLSGLSDSQRQLHAALETAMSIDDLLKATATDPARLRADLTILELRRVVVRTGAKFERVN